jgi:hypothetical protein
MGWSRIDTAISLALVCFYIFSVRYGDRWPKLNSRKEDPKAFPSS